MTVEMEIAIRDSQSGELTTEELGVLPDDFGYRETRLKLPIVQPNIQSQVLVQTKHDCCMGSTSDRAYYLIWDCNRGKDVQHTGSEQTKMYIFRKDNNTVFGTSPSETIYRLNVEILEQTSITEDHWVFSDG